jgi:hypothetical protein
VAWLDDFREGLAVLPDRRVTSATAGDPVSIEQLREVLDYHDPDQSYEAWRDVVAAIRNTNAGSEEDRFALAHEWSERAITKYNGPDPVTRVWETMPPRVGGVGFGTLYHGASLRGYAGAPFKPISLVDRFDLPKHAQERVGEWINFSDTFKVQVPDVQEHIPGFVERGVVTLLSGPGGVNKSRVAMQWGLTLSAARPVWERKCIPATLMFLSYEDSANEMARRSQMIRAKLDLPDDTPARWLDLTEKYVPLAVADPDNFAVTPLYERVKADLAAIEGPKLLVLNNVYDAVQFMGNAKIIEAPVVRTIAALADLGRSTDTTVLGIYHPSRAGMGRGDMTANSTAWENRVRGYIIMKHSEDIDGAVEIQTTKRNNGPRMGEPMLLKWEDGALLPMADASPTARRERLFEAVLQLTIDAAIKSAKPIRQRARLDEWLLLACERLTGIRPTEKEFKQIVSEAALEGRLVYKEHTRDMPAGFYPPDKGGEGVPARRDPYSD